MFLSHLYSGIKRLCPILTIHCEVLHPIIKMFRYLAILAVLPAILLASEVPFEACK